MSKAKETKRRLMDSDYIDPPQHARPPRDFSLESQGETLMRDFSEGVAELQRGEGVAWDDLKKELGL